MQDDTLKSQTTQEVTGTATEEPTVAAPVRSLDDIKPSDVAEEEPEEIEEDPEPDATPDSSVDASDEAEESEDTEETGSADTQKALSILQVEDLINRQMEEIEKMRDDTRMMKSAYDDAFKNDAKFREFDEKTKEAGKLKKQYVQGMKKDPAIANAESQYLAKKDELKDAQTGLSEYLREYNRISGMTQFETKDGQMLEIVQTFKLVKK